MEFPGEGPDSEGAEHENNFGNVELDLLLRCSSHG
jgi:hypothetical protein